MHASYTPQPKHYRQETEELWSDSHARRRARGKRRRRRVLLSLVFLLAFSLIAAVLFWLPPLISSGSGGALPAIPQKASLSFPEADDSLPAQPDPERDQDLASIAIPDWIDQELLDLGGSRSGEKLEQVNDLAIHYVANPGTSAQGNRNYFNDPATEVNAHFLIGLDGEILQCVPLDEKSAATNERNRDTISIEVCHPDETGQFTDASYQSLVRLCAWLCGELGLDETNLIRHYDVTGKLCPLYFVDHPEAWDAFRADVGAALR